MEPNATTTEVRAEKDNVAKVLMSISRYVFLIPLGIAPILFVPGVNTAFEYTKLFPIMVASLVAVIFYSLATLRTGELIVPKSWSLVALWGVVLAAVVSALLSGDIYDSVIGDTMPTQSALFLVLLAGVTSLVTVIGVEKNFVMKLYMLFVGSACILGIFHILRLVFGAGILQFGIFGSSTSSLLGNWNDLALFYGLCIIVSLVVLEQLPLTKWGRILFGVVTTIALLMLAVVNFFAVWLVLALVSLLVLMYTLVKDRFQVQPSLTGPRSSNTSLTSILMSALVFVVSMIFIVGGSLVGSLVSNATNISYVEVRPAALATTDIATNIYRDNALFGIGPNRFGDAWRLYKDPSINNTLFWDVRFASGYSFMLTQAATNGAMSVVAWLTFLALFVLNGFRTLFRNNDADRVMNFIHISSFTAALYLWGMTFIYNPGTILMVLTALFTGIALMSSASLQNRYITALSVFRYKASAMLLIGGVMIMIVGSASLMYFSARHYAAVYTYTEALQAENSEAGLEAAEKYLTNAIGLVGSDTYMSRMAQYQLLKMETLLNLEEPNAEQQKQFEQASAIGLQSAQAAVAQDRSEPLNWIILARLYGILAVVGVDKADTVAQEAYGEAYKLAPSNPSYRLLEARFLVQTGDTDAAREKLNEAISLKSNYTDALFFLAQLEVQAGNTDKAIQAAESMVALEPQNAARLYQLGVLQLSTNNTDEAVKALERAVSIDGNFSNARYFLATAYAQQGNKEAALAQLQKVLELNPGNEQVTSLMEDISGGTFSTAEASDPLPESSSVSDDDSVVTTESDPDTDLVAPVNTVPSTEAAVSDN